MGLVGGFPSLGSLRDIMASFPSFPSPEMTSSIPPRFTTIDSKQQGQPIVNETFTAKKKECFLSSVPWIFCTVVGSWRKRQMYPLNSLDCKRYHTCISNFSPSHDILSISEAFTCYYPIVFFLCVFKIDFLIICVCARMHVHACLYGCLLRETGSC